jgi:hypothetical protein
MSRGSAPRHAGRPVRGHPHGRQFCNVLLGVARWRRRSRDPFRPRVAPIRSRTLTHFWRRFRDLVQRCDPFPIARSPIRSNGRTRLVQHSHPFRPALSPIRSGAITHLVQRDHRSPIEVSPIVCNAIDENAALTCWSTRSSGARFSFAKKPDARRRDLSLVAARVESGRRES